MGRVIAKVRTLAAAGLGHGGPSVTSMAMSLRLAVLGALVIWNLVLAVVVLIVDPKVPPLTMAVTHVALAGLCALALQGWVRFDLCLALGFGVWLVDYVVARSVDDAVTLAACWLGNLLYVGSAIALRNRARSWLPILGSIVVVAVIVNVSPIWDLKTASAFVVTALAVVVTARFAMPELWSLAEAADENAAALEEQQRTEALVRRTSAAAAEDTRVLHDAVINTLGAVANSGDYAPTVDAMRERCRRDLRVVEQMLQGRRERQRDFTRLGVGSGMVKVVCTGLSDADLDELGDLLTADAADAVLRAVDEAVRNVDKHAGVTTATVDVSRTEAGVRVKVTDHGVGFDPRAEFEGHGLSGSISERVHSVGGDVAVTSEVGHGTEVVISLPFQGFATDQSAVYGSARSPSEIATALTRRACWLLGTGTVVVGLVIELANRPRELTWTYAMLAGVGFCIALAFGATRRRRVLPWPAAAVLTTALPAAFVAGMAGIDFGRTHVLTYQAIGIVPIIVILLSTTDIRWAVTAMTGLVTTAAVMVAVMSSKSADLGLVVLVGVAPAVGLGIGWWGFQRIVLKTIEGSEELRRKTFIASVDAAVQLEVARARQRWGTASLERAATLLKGVGEAELDPADAAVQEACAIEERYLRQFLLLNPSSYRMSVWFAHALAVARSNGVALTIRSGDQDAPDGVAAAVLGNVVLEAVTRAPEGAALTVAWFPTSDGVRLSIVGPVGDPQSPPGAAQLPDSWSLVRTVIVDREMVEVIVA